MKNTKTIKHLTSWHSWENNPGLYTLFFTHGINHFQIQRGTGKTEKQATAITRCHKIKDSG